MITASLKARLSRLEKVMMPDYDCPLVCWIGQDQYEFFCFGHPLNGQTLTKTQIQELRKELGDFVIHDFNADSGRARPETIGEAMERLGDDWMAKASEEKRRGVERVLVSPDGLPIYDFGANAKHGRFWPAYGEVGELSLEIIEALQEAVGE